MEWSIFIPWTPAIGGAIGQLARQGFAMLNRFLKKEADKPVYFNWGDSFSKIVLGAIGAAALANVEVTLSTNPAIGLVAGIAFGYSVMGAGEKGKSILKSLFKKSS